MTLATVDWFLAKLKISYWHDNVVSLTVNLSVHCG